MIKFMQPSKETQVASAYRFRSTDVAERVIRDAIRPAPIVGVTAETAVKVRGGGFAVRRDGRGVALRGGWS